MECERQPEVRYTPHAHAEKFRRHDTYDGEGRAVDDEVFASCENCPDPVSLGSCSISFGHETVYACPGCGGTLLVIGAPDPDGMPWPGRGFRIRDFVLRNAVDLTYRGVLIPKSPNALAADRT